MHNITFISTMHEKLGKCNADELCKILENERPEVVFLEALEETYSQYDRMIFSSFGVYHQKLEIEAIQKYLNYNSIEYVPVLDNALTDLFEEKYKDIPENSQLLKMLDEFSELARSEGFQFLNSQLSMELHAKMRMFENRLSNNDQLDKAFISDLDDYENSMIRNIYSYCRTNRFNKAVFMCGSAHRQSLIEKISNFQKKDNLEINWVTYGNKG